MRRIALVIVIGLMCCIALTAEPLPGVKPVGPLSPRDEQATFKLPAGFKAELVAAEPEVIDPVAMTFDENGRLFVVEMRGYPNGGIGEGKPNLPGRVKLLEDLNHDGHFEKATVFVDQLRFPTGVCCWNGGIYVADAPDLLYCKDADGDGQAELRQPVYTGFGMKNIQQLLNGLQFQFDNHIHGCNGSNDSVVSIPDKENGADKGTRGQGDKGSGEDKGTGGQGDKGKVDAGPLVSVSPCPPVPLRGRHFRFRPTDPASFEPTSGGGQYGLASDDWGNWFTCTNSQHLRHIVLPDHYLKRNPHLAVPAVVTDIPDGNFEHTPAAKVFRLSPFEAWRVERTSRRVKDPSYNKRLPATELVPGGYITSGTGLTVYRGGQFPPEFEGNIFVGDPANNLVHRDVLLPVGATFIARRHETERDCEFLASTDNWFRPVFLTQGPDGALYVCDFYREIIETPLSLPEDIQKQYNLNSRERGRIWRIVHAETHGTPKKPTLANAPSADLVLELANPNAWWRLTAQRLLIERQAKDAADLLATMVHTHTDKKARLHALWTLHGLGVLEPRTVQLALRDRAWQVREQGLRVAEPLLDQDRNIRQAALSLVNDPTPRVRFQLAFSLGQAKGEGITPALAKLAQKDGVSPWVQAAILSSAAQNPARLLQEVAAGDGASPAFIARLAAVVGAAGKGADIDQTISTLTVGDQPLTVGQMEILESLARGLPRNVPTLGQRTLDKTQELRSLRSFLNRAAKIAGDEKALLAERVAAVRLLGHDTPTAALPLLRSILTPQTPLEVELAAVQSLSRLNTPEATDEVLEAWPSLGPSVRREAQEMLFARPERLPQLLTALEKGTVQASQLDLPRREQLLKHANPQIKDRAAKVLAGQIPADRKKVLEEHQSVLTLTGDAAKGKLVFKKNCTTCHRLENEGFEVGPDLLSALKTKTKETLLNDILDPSRDVDARYLNYVARTTDGRLVTGLIATETASSLMLRRAEKAEDTLLRSEIDAIQSTAKSLMPEGLEKQVQPQELADVIAYLLDVAGRR